MRSERFFSLKSKRSQVQRSGTNSSGGGFSRQVSNYEDLAKVASSAKSEGLVWEEFVQSIEVQLQEACRALAVVRAEADDHDGTDSIEEITEELFNRTRDNCSEGGLACLVFDYRGLRFATSAYEQMSCCKYGMLSGTEVKKLPNMMYPCQSAPALNFPGWRCLSGHYNHVLGVTTDDKSHLSNVDCARVADQSTPKAASQGRRIAIKDTEAQAQLTDSIIQKHVSRYRQAVITTLISADEDEEPFWNTVYACGAEHAGRVYVVWMMLPAVVHVPDFLAQLLAGNAGAYQDKGEYLKGLLNGMMQKVCAAVEQKGRDIDPLSALRLAEATCTQVSKAFESEEEATRGDNLVPKLGTVSVSAFKHLGGLCDTIMASWKKPDDLYRPLKRESPEEPAWCLCDPGDLDCPVVYVSLGFEVLTGFWKAYALGRNCRFMQPRAKARNWAYNGIELTRIREFCLRKEGHLVALMLSEGANGDPIWQILYLLHVMAPGPDNSAERPYIFGLSTHLYVQTPILNELLPWEWNDQSSTIVKALRHGLSDRMNHTTLQQDTIATVADEAITEWLLEYGRDSRVCYVGKNFAPRVGLAAVRAFHHAAPWRDIVSETAATLKTALNADDDVISATLNNDAAGLACAVMDPSFKECPVVFVSQAFTALYGRKISDAGIARNSRFMHPNCPRLDAQINGEESKRLGEFCERYVSMSAPGAAQRAGRSGRAASHTTSSPAAPPLGSMLSLLLCETSSGEWFWNFFFLRHVVVRGRQYVLSVSSKLDIHMPGILLCKQQSKWYEDEMGRIADEWSVRIARLREMIRERESEGLKAVTDLARKYLLKHMKACEDYEGDHFVPKIGMKEVRHFKDHYCLQEVVAVVKEEVRRITSSKNWEGQDLAYIVADPSGPGCPLVHMSRGFEELYGYHTDFGLGRNSRFVQPKVESLNKLFNGPELSRIEAFCASHAPPKAEKSLGEDAVPAFALSREPETRMVSLLVNAHRERFPLWCLYWLEAVEAGGRKYIVGVHTRLEAGGRLVELLAGDAAGLEQLAKLRGLLLRRETCLKFENLKMLGKRCLEEWLVGYPPVLELPRVECEGTPWPFPLVGLELNSVSADVFYLVEAMEDGLRHFHITYPTYCEVKDDNRHEFESRLMALRLAEMLNRIRKHHLQYLRAGICFSIRTPPYLLSAFAEIRKAVMANGMQMFAWLLDAANATKAEIAESWAVMSQAKLHGEVKVVGLLGGGAQALHIARATPKAAPVSVYAVEMLPGHRLSSEDQALFAQVRRSGGAVMAHGIFGENQAWLNSEQVQSQAKRLRMDPVSLLLKWVEQKGFAALVPFYREAPGTASGSHGRGEGDMAAKATGRSSSKKATKAAYSSEDWKRARAKSLLELSAEPNVHRTFVRDYRSAPDAQVCALALSGDEALSVTDANRKSIFLSPQSQEEALRGRGTCGSCTLDDRVARRAMRNKTAPTQRPVTLSSPDEQQELSPLPGGAGDSTLSDSADDGSLRNGAARGSGTPAERVLHGFGVASCEYDAHTPPHLCTPPQASSPQPAALGQPQTAIDIDAAPPQRGLASRCAAPSYRLRPYSPPVARFMAHSVLEMSPQMSMFPAEDDFDFLVRRPQVSTAMSSLAPYGGRRTSRNRRGARPQPRQQQGQEPGQRHRQQDPETQSEGVNFPALTLEAPMSARGLPRGGAIPLDAQPPRDRPCARTAWSGRTASARAAPREARSARAPWPWGQGRAALRAEGARAV